jgi:hypothetical protein
LQRAFVNLGARVDCAPEFGDNKRLASALLWRGYVKTSTFVRLVEELYPRSLGPWCVIEALSFDWMTGLCEGLTVHFPGIQAEPYFAECFDNEVEEKHASVSLEITEQIIAERALLVPEVIASAKWFATQLNGVWDDMLMVCHKTPLKTPQGQLRS